MEYKDYYKIMGVARGVTQRMRSSAPVVGWRIRSLEADIDCTELLKLT